MLDNIDRINGMFKVLSSLLERFQIPYNRDRKRTFVNVGDGVMDFKAIASATNTGIVRVMMPALAARLL